MSLDAEPGLDPGANPATPPHIPPLTIDELMFLKKFAGDAVAGRHVLCLLAQGLVAMGKIAFALSVIGAMIAMLFGWRIHHT